MRNNENFSYKIAHIKIYFKYVKTLIHCIGTIDDKKYTIILGAGGKIINIP